MADDPTVLDAMSVLVRYVLRDHRGVRVGIVTKYDAQRRTADVQPVRRRRVRGTVYDEAPVVDAPVGTWRLGGMVLAGELEVGDEVLLVTCEREIRPWWLGGKAHDPQSRRMHAPEDSVVLPWISNVTRAITAQAPGTLYLGREDGTAGITITRGPAPGRTTVEGTGPGSVVLGSAAVDTLVRYPAHASAFATWATAMANAGAAVATPGVPDPTGALYTTYAAAVTAATATLATAIAAAPTMGTVKVVAE